MNVSMNMSTEILQFPQSTSHLHNNIPSPCRGIVGFYRAYFSPSIALLGLLGNALVIWLNVCDPKRSRFTIYSISLAMSHSLILLMNSVLDDFLGRGLCYALHATPPIKLDSMSNASCKLMEYVPNSLYAWSSWTLVVFTVDRLLTVVNPIHFFSTRNISKCVLACVLVALLAMLVHIPVLLSYRLVANAKLGLVHGWKCDVLPNSILGRVFLNFKIFGTFIVPTGAILVLDVAICIVLGRQLRRRQDMLFSTNAGQNRREMNRVIGHLALSGTFLLFNLPLVVVMILRLHATFKGHTTSEQLATLSRLFSSTKDATYAADFILYFSFLRSFRKRALKLMQRPLVACGCPVPKLCELPVKSQPPPKEATQNRDKFSAVEMNMVQLPSRYATDEEQVDEEDEEELDSGELSHSKLRLEHR